MFRLSMVTSSVAMTNCNSMASNTMNGSSSRSNSSDWSGSSNRSSCNSNGGSHSNMTMSVNMSMCSNNCSRSNLGIMSNNSRRFPWEKDCEQIIISVKKEVVKNGYFSVFTWSLWGRPSCGAEQEDIAAKRGLIGR